MKKALLTLICLAALMTASMSIKAQEVTIMLKPGWTWISYPSADTVDFATALGTFTPRAGDVIACEYDYSEYFGGEWLGGIQHFYPGYGYMYYSSRNMPVFLTFNAQQSAPQVVVTTSEPMLITAISAMGGGEVTVSDGTYILAKGLCWATHENPTTNDDFYQEAESGVGSFSLSMTGLNISTTYYVRAYAVTANGTVYGDQKNFTTLEGYVDLGLPSGTLWATCNVGTDIPEGYGSYFAWGETQTKNYYDWDTYLHYNGSDLTKYTESDGLTTLLPEDDAATANWGNNWRMPTVEEWQELYANTTCTWTTQNGVNGRLFTASNGNSLFLPAAGQCEGSYHYYAGSDGYYWSSSLKTDNPTIARTISISSGSYGQGGYGRNHGLSVRAVRCKNSVINVTTNSAECGSVNGGGTYMDRSICTVSATANEGFTFVCWSDNGLMVSTETTYSFIVSGNRNLVAFFYDYNFDLGLPSGTLWATCNVGADTPEGYGDHFAWGETQPKDNYGWNTYQYCNGSSSSLTKYCSNSSYGNNGFTDNLTTLLPEDDAATANWGTEWRMPTQAEWLELWNLPHTWATLNGVYGKLFTASNGNSLFLPAAGYRKSSSLYNAGSSGYYWSSSLETGRPDNAWRFYIYLSSSNMTSNYRSSGLSVRAVRSAPQE